MGDFVQINDTMGTIEEIGLFFYRYQHSEQ
ncbi:mechanosensitive ion channel domain-containing protein [Acidithiobacillus thiooxidans]